MNQNEKYVAIWHLYESEHGHKPSRMSDAVAWGIRKNLLREPPPISGLKVLERRLARAVGQEYDTSKGPLRAVATGSIMPFDRREVVARALSGE